MSQWNEFWNLLVRSEHLHNFFSFEGFNTVITILIAFGAVNIAYQQWKTNHTKLKLDLYDRRLIIYKEVSKFISVIIQNGQSSYQDLGIFYAKTMEADFLFGIEIREYIDEIHKHAKNLTFWSEKYRDYTQEKPEGYNHDEVVANIDKELQWITQQILPPKNNFKWIFRQMAPAQKRFKKYLHIDTLI